MSDLAILSAFLQVAFDRLATPEFKNFVFKWKIDSSELESLKQTSAMIQALSNEAEVKQFSNGLVKLWLDRLKQLLYDAEDTLDEYATEVLRQQLESENQSQQVSSSAPLTSVKKSASSLYNFFQEPLRVKTLGSKVRDIDGRLKSMQKQGLALGLNLSVGSGSSRPKVFSERPPTGSSVDRSDVFGREKDVEKILEWLLSNKTLGDKDKNFSVQPIVGMGGSGKTTLAQLVFNDKRVDDYFGRKAWACVSEDFDVVRLTKEIFGSATKSSPPASNSLDLLQTKLQEVLSGKRFLLVLDDMWNELDDRWESLSVPFAFGEPGSKILVTTRNKGVASIVRTDNDHDLKGLSDEACLALVRRHAFGKGNSSDANQKLEAFGQEILRKCKGLPLAVKTLASLLRGKMENNEWKAILEDEIWDLGPERSEILPSLMLSYHHLPPHLKRCFTYCALFPKDYVFNKIELVLLWMAEGMVPLEGKKRPEDIGASYFEELFMRSFFELSDRRPCIKSSAFALSANKSMHEKLFHDLSDALCIKSFFKSSDSRPSNKPSSFSPLEKSLYGSHSKSYFEPSSFYGSGFVMHNLIHDLAQFVSGKIYCRRENDKPSEVLKTTRHLSYLTDNCKIDQVSEFESMKSLRTILNVKEDNTFCPTTNLSPTIQFQFQFQFLRVLRIRNCHNCELPDSIGELKHLRLLDLSFSDILKLPNSITSLYNLQTLVLIGCLKLEELPEHMGKLVNLRHLFLPVIPAFMQCSYKMPLGESNFRGLQTLSRFVVGPNNIGALKHLSLLRGALDISNLENMSSNGMEAILAHLKDKRHLLGLRLHWGCNLERCQEVEENTLNQLQPHTNLQALCIENYGGMRFPNWIEYPTFSSLEVVGLIDCDKCRLLPHLWQLPKLKHLVIVGCKATKNLGSDNSSGHGTLSMNKQFRSLQTLFIKRMNEWEVWPEEVKEKQGGGQFPCLRELVLDNCPKLRMFSHSFPCLVLLHINNCGELIKAPPLLPSLLELHIGDCPKLVQLPSLHSIERLMLASCLQIMSCADNSYPYLCELDIYLCPNLRELPCSLPSLGRFFLRHCKELCVLPILPSIKDLQVEECKGMVLNGETLSDHLSSLSSLSIRAMSGLESLSHGFTQHLTALQNLRIFDCKGLMVLVENEIEGLKNFRSLQSLEISKCENIKTLPKELHTLTSLQEFVLVGCPAVLSFQETMLPTSLQNLRIKDCKNLESLPMGLLDQLTSLRVLELSRYPNLTSLPEGLHKLTSLQRLEIRFCPGLEFFPNMEYLPPALQYLSVSNCVKLNSLPKGLHKLTNLQDIEIVGCGFLMVSEDLEPLRSLGLDNFTSFSSVTIGGCPNLVSIPRGLFPTNLESFCIRDCPILESISDMLCDLTSLAFLSIRNCPMLAEQYWKKEGEEWSKIVQIPDLEIDHRKHLK